MKYQKTMIVTRILAVITLIVALYQFWLVVGRWIAVLYYINEFRADSGTWITLGLDTVIFGLASLLFVGGLSFYNRQKARHANDSLSKVFSSLSIGITIVATIALLVLVALPTVAFRRM